MMKKSDPTNRILEQGQALVRAIVALPEAAREEALVMLGAPMRGRLEGK